MDALLPDATPAQSRAILGAMRAVAETGGPASEADRRALVSADRFVFGHRPPVAFDELPAVTPAELASALAGSALAREAMKFLAVMALVDARLDRAKIARVMDYAAALGVHEHFLDQIVEAAQDRLQEVLADMTRCNMESITGRAWQGGDVNRWLLPYGGDGADAALAARFAALERYPAESFGHAFWAHFRRNAYAFPGEAAGLNQAFSVPHDTVHVLTGFNTSPRGEILVSTFTAAMHPRWPMAGHVLPVIFSWHLQMEINAVAKSAAGALDPEMFWQAWAAGAAATVDTFAPEFDFWAHAETPLPALRERWSIPAEGIDRPPAA